MIAKRSMKGSDWCLGQHNILMYKSSCLNKLSPYLSTMYRFVYLPTYLFSYVNDHLSTSRCLATTLPPLSPICLLSFHPIPLSFLSTEALGIRLRPDNRLKLPIVFCPSNSPAFARITSKHKIQGQFRLNAFKKRQAARDEFAPRLRFTTA